MTKNSFSMHLFSKISNSESKLLKMHDKYDFKNIKIKMSHCCNH